MKTLILMRHAKSDWSTGQPDIERPLNARGQRSALALGDWLRAQGHLPDEILCSSSQRTQETCDGLKLSMTPTLMRRLYHAEAAEMADVLRWATGDQVLMLGHNPGIAEFAFRLCDDIPAHPDFARYPTCATLVIRFDIDTWQELEMESGTVIDFAVPRALTD